MLITTTKMFHPAAAKPAMGWLLSLPQQSRTAGDFVAGGSSVRPRWRRTAQGSVLRRVIGVLRGPAKAAAPDGSKEIGDLSWVYSMPAASRFDIRTAAWAALNRRDARCS